ncbi:MAG: putative periplasmic solute-binding protein [Chthonomonadales bacterium]|nr:putative periplasmic solute-binding protein [Chthonomonadales bacterium]
MKLRIGSVPYLNAKPLVDWFHSAECDADVEITYAVPSQLAQMLRRDELDVANVSIFEAFQNPDLTLVPGISISAYGAVKSVRLFSQVPLPELRTVALDTSSLTSVALTKILLSEQFHAQPAYVSQPPHLETMLHTCDAGLIIGDLKLFALHADTTVYDLGHGWFDLTGLPFVYAGWLARADRASPKMAEVLNRAKAWGLERLEPLAAKWAERMDLPLDRSRDYLLNVMNYDLTPDQRHGLETFHQKCRQHGLLPQSVTDK